MIAVDTNILVYAHRRDAELHAPAFEVVTSLAESGMLWAIPWPCIHEFLTVATHPKIYNPPSTLTEATEQVDAWMQSSTLVMLAETGDHWQHLQRELIDSKTIGPKVHDARIAAICRQHGVRELWTVDRDFSRFTNLTTVNPLQLGR